jgi:FkbM family methyltransferase
MTYCNANEISVKAVFDQSPRESQLAQSEGIAVRKIESPLPDDATSTPIAVCLSKVPVEPVMAELKSLGWGIPIPFYALTAKSRKGHPLQNGWRVGTISVAEMDAIYEVCDCLADDTSVDHYEAFVGWHTNYLEIMPKTLPIRPESRYIVPEVIESLNQRRAEMIDVGSHTGSSVQRFQRAGIEFDRYVLVEPDDHSRNLLSAKLSGVLPQQAHLMLVSEVLGASNSEVRFVDGLDYCSQIWEYGEVTRQSVTLDSLKLAPSLIKIHTEGSELDVLIGAQHTLDEYKPVVVSAIYHNRLGLCDLLTYFLRRHPSYDCYVRLHGFQGTNAYLYAIPR